jgi:hypothetical protein
MLCESSVELGCLIPVFSNCLLLDDPVFALYTSPKLPVYMLKNILCAHSGKMRLIREFKGSLFYAS